MTHSNNKNTEKHKKKNKLIFQTEKIKKWKKMFY